MNTLNEEINRIKTIMGLITEDTQNKIAVLLDGTSSAGKGFTLKHLEALPYWHPKADPNGWVVIGSDDFAGEDPQVIKNKIKYDHEGDGPNPQAGEEFHKEMAIERKGGFGENRGETTVGFSKHPHNKDLIPGHPDSRNWYMAQEFKHGGWNKIIFDDIGSGILQYLPDVNFKHILLHTPIHYLLENVKERNDSAVEGESRDPEDVLKQYLQKYEATKGKPDINVGDPTTEITKGWIEDKFKEHGVSEEFTKNFINELGIIDNDVYYIKVKEEYHKPDIQLVNVGSNRMEYLNSDAIQNLKGEESY